MHYELICPSNLLHMSIDKSSLERIKQVPITDVAEWLDFTLHNDGKANKRCLCPYHEDHHPSLRLNVKHNTFHCFVCGAGGDGIKLVMDQKGLDFQEACRWIADQYGLVIIEERSCKPKTTKKVAPQRAISTAPSAFPHQFLPSELVERARSNDIVFCRAMVGNGFLSEEQMSHAAQRYRLGRSREGGVVFWQTDSEQRVHNGKIMFYGPDGHRLHDHHPTWVAAELKKRGLLDESWSSSQCLFGLHLLPEWLSRAAEAPLVAVVESEKSAVILSEHFPDVLWLSCGGLRMFQPALLSPLSQCRTIAFPDTDPEGKSYRLWSDVAAETSKAYAFRYSIRVSPILEEQATLAQKEAKADLVDYLFSSEAPVSFAPSNRMNDAIHTLE